MRALRSRGPTLLALAAGAAPGFLLPVAVTWRLPLVQAAALLLALTLTQIAYGMLGAPYETTMLTLLGPQYGANTSEPRLPAGHLAAHAVTRLGPILIVAASALVAGAGLISSDINLRELTRLAIPLVLALVVQIATAGLTAHLYVVRRFPSAYFATFFLGGPSLLVLFLWPDAQVLAITYLIGHLLRWMYLAWRVHVSQQRTAHSKHTAVDTPSWSELMPQVISSVGGQMMPMLVQGLLASSGAAAIANGAIAFRIWAAASQVGTSTIAMPEVVTLTREVCRVDPKQRSRWVTGGAIRVAIATLLLAIAGAVALTILNLLLAGFLPSAVAAGIWWALITLTAFPAAMLNFWAGRGLVTIHFGWWLPVSTSIAFVVGGATSAIVVPLLGGIGAIITFAIGFIVQGITTFALFLKFAPRATLPAGGDMSLPITPGPRGQKNVIHDTGHGF